MHWGGHGGHFSDDSSDPDSNFELERDPVTAVAQLALSGALPAEGARSKAGSEPRDRVTSQPTNPTVNMDEPVKIDGFPVPVPLMLGAGSLGADPMEEMRAHLGGLSFREGEGHAEAGMIAIGQRKPFPGPSSIEQGAAALFAISPGNVAFPGGQSYGDLRGMSPPVFGEMFPNSYKAARAGMRLPGGARWGHGAPPDPRGPSGSGPPAPPGHPPRS